ncbi:Segregation and condensation protein B [compost metagenome]
MSQAALETLSIIAYRQPITRIEVEEIRGVKSERAIHTLVNKDLIQEVGRAEAIGRPILYGTTAAFLDYFGLGSLEELPELTEFESTEQLEEETQLLFQKLEEQQLTFDDVNED